MFSMFLAPAASAEVPYPSRLPDRTYRVSEPRRPRLTRMTARSVSDDAELADRIQEFLREDAEWVSRSAEVSDAQMSLRRRVSRSAWLAYLLVEERDVSRWHYALLVVARHAFASGAARR